MLCACRMTQKRRRRHNPRRLCWCIRSTPTQPMEAALRGAAARGLYSRKAAASNAFATRRSVRAIHPRPKKPKLASVA